MRDGFVLHITHFTSTPNCQWVMDVGTSPHYACCFNTQQPMADGGWVHPPHHTFHFNSLQPMADGTEFILHITHLTSTLNCQLPIGGGSSSSLYMPVQLLTADGNWVLHITQVISTLNCKWLIGGWGSVPPPHCTCYFNSQLQIADTGGVVSSPFHIQLMSHHLGVGKWRYPPYLTNQVECASAVKPNWLSSLYDYLRHLEFSLVLKSLSSLSMLATSY